MEGFMSTATSSGESVLGDIPARIAAIDAEVQQSFSSTPADYRTQLQAAGDVAKASNGKLLEATANVHTLLMDAVDDFRSLELWLTFRVPAISDGNNFGVEVQDHVIAKLDAFKAKSLTDAESLAAYTLARATAREKFGSSESVEKTRSASTEKKEEGGKAAKDDATTKEETVEKKVEKLPMDDVVAHVVELDVKHYCACRAALHEVAKRYIQAHLLVNNNKDKCMNPRGDSSSGGRTFTMY